MSSGAVWEPVVGYSRAVRVGQWVSVAGTTAARAGAGPVGGADIAEQTREAIRRIAAALQEVEADAIITGGLPAGKRDDRQGQGA